MEKTLHFLSGIPRSGSTVLAAILNQNPLTHVSTTSNLVVALDGLANTWGSNHTLNESDKFRVKLAKIMRSVIDTFYAETDKPVVIDKSRSWPFVEIMSAMEQVLERPMKVIATVRSVPDCAASLTRALKTADLDNFVYQSQHVKHLRASYQALQAGYTAFPECFLFVDYDDLMENPARELQRIHMFLSIPYFEYNLNTIDGSTVKEDDLTLHGCEGLHDIRSKLERANNPSAQQILGEYYNAFCQPEFWSEKQKAIPTIHPLDLQLAVGTQGNFAEGWRLAQELERDQPHNKRAAFNRGWYKLMQGKIQEGYSLLEHGRIADCFGSLKSPLNTPVWDGKSKGHILFVCEGGFGDQIHQLRFVKNLADRGCTVTVACNVELVKLFSESEYVSSVVTHHGMHEVYHDAWIPAMSIVRFLGLELNDLEGGAYVRKPVAIKGKKKRIGLRWAGNQVYEHMHNKLFPSKLLFDAVKNIDAEFICLQRDVFVEDCPDWVKKVPLDNWTQTQEAVAGCDLVITACTSVSHLSGAMGIPTWVVLPIMPYFLYAMQGETTPYYDSFTLFRQEKFGEWEAPFEKIKQRLQETEPCLKLVA